MEKLLKIYVRMAGLCPSKLQNLVNFILFFGGGGRNYGRRKKKKEGYRERKRGRHDVGA